MMKPRILSTALGLTIFVFFAFIISLDVYDSSIFLLSLLGGLLTAICFAQAVINFESFYEFMSSREEGVNEDGSKKSSSFYILSGIMTFFCAISLWGIHSKKVENELKYYGIADIAEITDGFHEMKKSRRSVISDYHLTLKFQDKKGNPQVIHTSVDRDLYDKVGLNLKLPIIYSSNYPTVYKLVTDPTIYANEYSPKATANGQTDKYLKYISKLGDYDVLPEQERTFRHVNISDLMAIDTLSSGKILDRLVNIGQTWENISDKDGLKWANEGRGEMIYKNDDNIKLSVFYNDSTFVNIAPLKYLKYLEFTETSKDKTDSSKSRTYEHPKYILSIEPQILNDSKKAFILNSTLKHKSK
jgi:hypothetical protein